MPTQLSVKRIFWVVLAVALIIWVGVGMFLLTTKKPAVPISPTVEQEFKPWTNEYSPEQPLKTVEGFYGIFDYQNSHFTLEVDDKTYSFIIPQDVKGFIMPGTKFRLKIYYQERDDKLILIAGERARGKERW